LKSIRSKFTKNALTVSYYFGWIEKRKLCERKKNERVWKLERRWKNSK